LGGADGAVPFPEARSSRFLAGTVLRFCMSQGRTYPAASSRLPFLLLPMILSIELTSSSSLSLSPFLLLSFSLSSLGPSGHSHLFLSLPAYGAFARTRAFVPPRGSFVNFIVSCTDRVCCLAAPFTFSRMPRPTIFRRCPPTRSRRGSARLWRARVFFSPQLISSFARIFGARLMINAVVSTRHVDIERILGIE